MSDTMAMRPSGHIYMYNGNETFESDTMEFQANVRLDLSQNNKQLCINHTFNFPLYIYYKGIIE